MHLSQIETPALILDRRSFEENLRTMQRILAPTGAALRPHYKSHKCLRIAQLQLAAGAKGITCAKLSEAEDLARAGVGDILIANQIVQPEKLGRLAALAARTRLTVCVDAAENVRQLERAMAAQEATLYVLVEYEIGMRRCGVASEREVIELARLIEAQPHLRFEGVQAYAGHMAHEPDEAIRRADAGRIEDDLRTLREALIRAGLPPKELSGVSTGTVVVRPADTVYTEFQCGSYLFLDRAYRALGLPFQNALFLLTTVISTKPDRVVTDGGTKSLGMDQGDPLVVGYEECPVQMSEEHSQFDRPGHGLRPGDALRLIPGHCCTTINSHDVLYLVEDGEVVDLWPITSRGKAQ